MSDFNVGDKVYLECEVKGRGRGKDRNDNIYLLKYRNRCGDEYETDFVTGDILHTTDDYNKGLEDAWELAKKIILPTFYGGYSSGELQNIFGYRSPESVLKAFTPQEALAKVKAYDNKMNSIRVGDVVTVKGGISDFESIVTKVSGRVVYRLFMDGSCDGNANKEDLVKTGRHFESIDEFMRSDG